MSELEIRPSRFGAPVAQRLLAAAQADLASRYGSGDANPVAALQFAPPEGGFVVAWRDGEPIGCGGWRRLGDSASVAEGIAEVKRMYVTPAARQTGVARAILAALEESARQEGLKRLVLETGRRQPEAIALYERLGYDRIPNYGYYKDEPDCVSFGRVL